MNIITKTLKFTTLSFLLAAASFAMASDTTDSDNDSQASAGRSMTSILSAFDDALVTNLVDTSAAVAVPVSSVLKKRSRALPDQRAFSPERRYEKNRPNQFSGNIGEDSRYGVMEIIGLGSPRITGDYARLVSLGFDCPVHDGIDHLCQYFGK